MSLIQLPDNVGPVEFNTAVIELSAAFENAAVVVRNLFSENPEVMQDRLNDFKHSAMWANQGIALMASAWPVPVEILAEPVDDAVAHNEPDVEPGVEVPAGEEVR